MSKISMDLVRIRLEQAEENLGDASDYNDFYVVSKDDTENIINTSLDLYNCAKEYIKNWCKENNIVFE